MNDADAAREAALDETLRKARETVQASERLAAAAEEGLNTFAEWKKANGIQEDTNEKFLAKLPPEALRQYEEEREREAIQDAHDRENALRQAQPAKAAAAAPKRRRNMA